MNILQLTRKEMADLLLSLKGWNEKKALTVLQDAWIKSRKTETTYEIPMNAFITTALPPIFEKLVKTEELDIGFSLNEIGALGNQIQHTSFSVTALQNWVKRDLKDMVGPPQRGKKYSIEQAALLFIVEDLKTALDFDSIRKLLSLIVNDPSDRDDDLISPIRLYSAYSSLFEKLNFREATAASGGDAIIAIEQEIEARAADWANSFPNLHANQREAVRNVIVIAALSVHTAHFQMLAKRYVSATLFLQNLTISNPKQAE
ncbi:MULTISPECIES: DUF1836 domain-containing protein [Bacillaceae]|uniref:DUF1836 domain-containing protein n=1 Tax=Ectobacillus funiculus TaxID=137993 RepID=A0ABV5WQ67_9BACI